jgi:hypothetical protein
MSASVGLIAMWTGQLLTNVKHMESMAIHQMSEEDIDLFAKYVTDAGYTMAAIAKYVKEQQEQS